MVKVKQQKRKKIKALQEEKSTPPKKLEAASRSHLPPEATACGLDFAVPTEEGAMELEILQNTPTEFYMNRRKINRSVELLQPYPQRTTTTINKHTSNEKIPTPNHHYDAVKPVRQHPEAGRYTQASL